MLNERKLAVTLLVLDTAIIALAVYLGWTSDYLLKFFDEGEFITWFSSLKLIATGLLAVIIFIFRCKDRRENCWQTTSLIWLLIGIGFIFLAADESFEFHEKLDGLIHRFLQMKETRLSDRLDDMIVGLYVAIGAAFVFGCRKELRRYVKMYPYLLAGFMLCVAMVILDMYTNTAPGDWVTPLIVKLSVVEETLKIYAETFFLVPFFQAVRKVLKEQEKVPVPE